MNFKEMMDKDLADSFSLNEFGVEATHYFGVDSTETLNVIFDEATEVVLEKGEYAGAEVSVPSFQVPSFQAANIKHKSLFTINGETFGVIEKPKQADGTTIVHLDKQ